MTASYRSIRSVTSFLSYRQDTDCYGLVREYEYYGYPGWSSDNTSVATCNNGVATAVGVGSTWLRQQYYVDLYTPNIEECLVTSTTANAAASCTVAPTISGPNTLWWFNQENPAGYATSATLTASPANAGSYSWVITSGTAQLRFNDNSTSMVTSSNQVTVKTINSSGQQNDIGIKVTVNGVASNEFKLTSRTSWSFASLGQDNFGSLGIQVVSPQIL